MESPSDIETIGAKMSGTRIVNLSENDSIEGEEMKALAHGPYTRFRGMHNILNPDGLLTGMGDEPWIANRMTGTTSDFFSHENISMQFFARCGFDLTTSMECVFGTTSKAIGKERSWGDLALLYFNENLQQEQIKEFQEVVQHDPTRILDLYQAQLQKAESLVDVLLLLVNTQRYVVNGPIKKQMMMVGLNTVRVTQALAERNIWNNGTYWVTRSLGQNAVLNLNYPFTWDKNPLNEEVLDSSGDAFCVSAAFANFTDGRKGSAAIAIMQPRMTNQYPYLFSNAFFYANVHMTRDGLVTFDGMSVESTGNDVAAENPVANTNLEYIIWNSKYRPNGVEKWKLTFEVVKMDNLALLVVIPYHPFLEPARKYVKQRTSPTTLVGYKNAYKISWLTKLRMFAGPIKDSSMEPMDRVLKLGGLFQRKKRNVVVKTEPTEE